MGKRSSYNSLGVLVCILLTLLTLSMIRLSFADQPDPEQKESQLLLGRTSFNEEMQNTFDSLFGTSGSLYWLSEGSNNSDLNTIVAPYHSLNGDLSNNDYVRGDSNVFTGVTVDASDSSFLTDGFIYVFPDYATSDTAYGIYYNTASSVKIYNPGSIFVGIDSPTNDVFAYGLYSEANSCSLENSGNIFLEMEGSMTNGEMELYGLYSDSNTNTLTNSGNIFVHGSNEDNGNGAADVYPFGLYVEGGDTATLSNSGNVYIFGESADGDGTVMYSYGLLSYADENTLTNTGNILVESELEDTTANTDDPEIFSVGASAGDDRWANPVVRATINNSGIIGAYTTVTQCTGVSKAGAAGIWVGTSDSFSINNTGKIFTKATIENSTVKDLDMTGMGGTSAGTASVENAGDILVEAEFENASTTKSTLIGGISLAGKNMNVNNSGNIILKTTFNTSNVSLANYIVSGIYVDGGSANVRNSGLVSLETSFSWFSAAITFIDVPNGTLSNTGTIYVEDNIALLNLFGTRGLALFNSNVTLEDGFSYTFHNLPSITTKPIFVDSKSSLNLNDTTLIARASADTYFGIPYPVIENSGTVTGEFGSLENGCANPDITVDWATSDHGEGAAIVFGYMPQRSSGISSIHGAYTSMRNIMNRTFDYVFKKALQPLKVAKVQKPVLLADARETPTSLGYSGTMNTWLPNGVFMLPYYTNIDADDLGYDADLWGMELGFEKDITDNLKTGIFAGIGRTALDYDGFDDNYDNQDDYYGGLFGFYLKGNWYGAALVSFYRAVHHYNGETGPNLTIDENDRYSSWAIDSRILGGYIFRMGNFNLVPIFGLEYTPWHTESHTTDTAGNNGWQTHYTEDNEDFLKFLGGIDVNGAWETTSNTTISLSIGARLEQELNNNDISVIQTVYPARPSALGQTLPLNLRYAAKVEKNVNDTTFLGHGGISVAFDSFEFNATITGEYNDDYTAVGGYVTAGYKF